MNHITLAVKDLEESVEFYVSRLGLTAHARWAGGAHLTAGNTWICLSLERSAPSRDYSHIAFSVAQEEFGPLAERLRKSGVSEWKTNTSEGESLYFMDPDGHKLELHVGSLQTRLQAFREHPPTRIEWLR